MWFISLLPGKDTANNNLMANFSLYSWSDLVCRFWLRPFYSSCRFVVCCLIEFKQLDFQLGSCYDLLSIFFAFLLDFWIHFQKTPLGKGRMPVTWLPPLVPMELHQLWHTSSVKGMYSVPYAPTNTTTTW